MNNCTETVGLMKRWRSLKFNQVHVMRNIFFLRAVAFYSFMEYNYSKLQQRLDMWCACS